MKKWIIGLIVILAVAAIIALDQLGILKWQPLSMIAAAIAAPFRLIIGLFTSKEEEIRKRHKEIRRAQAIYREELESDIYEREQRVEARERELDALAAAAAAKLSERNQIEAEINSKTPDELRDLARQLLGS